MQDRMEDLFLITAEEKASLVISQEAALGRGCHKIHIWTKIPAEQQWDFCPQLPGDAPEMIHLQEAASAAAQH